jgi:hypothetical protein
VVAGVQMRMEEIGPACRIYRRCALVFIPEIVTIKAHRVRVSLGKRGDTTVTGVCNQTRTPEIDWFCEGQE